MMEKRIEEFIIDLVSMYQPVIRACCRCHHLPDDRAEDIMHDTFLAAYKDLASYNGQGKMSTWLWSIARRKILDQRRRESIRRRLERTWNYPPSLSETTEPVALAQTKELRDALHDAVATLPHVWMKVLTLYYWYQEPPKQIARRMQIRPGLVYVILHRSRKRLRESLESMTTHPNPALAVAS